MRARAHGAGGLARAAPISVEPCLHGGCRGLNGEQLLFDRVMKIARQPRTFFAAGRLTNLGFVTRAQRVHAGITDRVCLRVDDGEGREDEADHERCPDDGLGQCRREEPRGNPREQDAEDHMRNREATQAAPACLGVFDPCEGQRDQRGGDEYGAHQTRNDILSPRRRLVWMEHEECRLQFGAQRCAGNAAHADHAENRREDGIPAEDQLCVD